MPGPAVLFVVSQALREGPVGGLLASFGILAGNALYFVLSGSILGALLVESPRAFQALTWTGSAFLAYLGLRALAAAAPETTSVPRARGRRILLDGFLLQASNPKALVFFSAIVPQFLDARRPVTGQLLILGATGFVIELTTLTLYSRGAGEAAARSPRFAAIAQKVSGVALLIAAVGLPLLKR